MRSWESKAPTYLPRGGGLGLRLYWTKAPITVFRQSDSNFHPPPRGGQGGASIGKIEQCQKCKVFLTHSKSYHITL